MRRTELLALAGALTAAAAWPSAAQARPCAAFAFSQGGVQWRASEIVARRASCGAARRLVKAYAVPRNCQFERRCRVRAYRCRTVEAEGSLVVERCRRGRRVVRWRAVYQPR